MGDRFNKLALEMDCLTAYHGHMDSPEQPPLRSQKAKGEARSKVAMLTTDPLTHVASAYRWAVETRLQSEGLMTVSQSKKCYPLFSKNCLIIRFALHRSDETSAKLAESRRSGILPDHLSLRDRLEACPTIFCDVEKTRFAEVSR